MRHRGQEQPQPVAALDQQADGVAKDGRQALDLAASRPGQHEQRLLVLGGRLASLRLDVRCVQDAGVGGQAVADIGARRPAEARQGFRLEGQDAQDMVDIGPHRRGALGAPGPDARADIVDDGDARIDPSHVAGDAQGEFRAVDGDQAVRFGGGDGAGRGSDADQQARQVASDRGGAHQGDRRGVEQRLQPHGLEVATADADQLDGPAGQRFHSANQVGAEEIAGLLAGDQGQPDGRPVGHGAGVPSRPTTKRPSVSARSIVSA